MRNDAPDEAGYKSIMDPSYVLVPRPSYLLCLHLDISSIILIIASTPRADHDSRSLGFSLIGQRH